MLNQDFSDILSSLNAEQAEFLVVGAYALAAHGFPRATGDIDIWIRRSPENAQKVLRALARFGAPVADLSEADLCSPDLVFQMGVEPGRIDLLTKISGVEFDAAWMRKVKVSLANIELFVLSRSDLLTNKLAAGRDKDLGDIAWLKQHVEGADPYAG
jgi:Nucleotidyl transferase of unknown function (DUF2204)